MNIVHVLPSITMVFRCLFLDQRWGIKGRTRIFVIEMYPSVFEKIYSSS
jgi:hypothetical protein